MNAPEGFAALNATGISARQLAERFNVTLRTITRWRVETGTVIPSRPRLPDTARERARQLIDDGCSATETARTIGVSVKTIIRWFPDMPRWTKSDAGLLARAIERSGVHL